VFVDGRIVPITDDGAGLDLEDGWRGADRPRFFGCADLNGNGVVELVQLAGLRKGDEMIWTRRSWETVADRAELVVDERGRLPWAQPPDDELFAKLPDQFDHMRAGLSFGQDACQWVGR